MSKFIEGNYYLIQSIQYQEWCNKGKMFAGNVYRFLGKSTRNEKEGNATVGHFQDPTTGQNFTADIDWWYTQLSFKNCKDVTEEYNKPMQKLNVDLSLFSEEKPTEEGLYLWENNLGVQSIRVYRIPAHERFGCSWDEYLAVEGYARRNVEQFQGKFLKLEVM